MVKFRQCALVLLALLLSFPCRADEMTREEVREAWSEVSQWSEELMAREPSIREPFDAGAISEGAAEDALAYLNFIRQLAGLAPVSYSEVYAMYAQHASVLLASLGVASHDPPQPEGMSDDFYATAHAGAAACNIAAFGWSDERLLRRAILHLVRDEGEQNRGSLGHRRWALSPEMAETGFGFATDESGGSFATMYAVDRALAPDWDLVAWPAAGAFPAEMLSEGTAWSITLNPAVYDIASSRPTARLTEETSGAVYEFSFSGEAESGYSAVSTEEFGAGPCLILEPVLARYGMHAYEQNQVWRLSVMGLVGRDGETREIAFTVRMISLFPQSAVSVEMDASSLALTVGESQAIRATVLPTYADDVTVTWTSSDPQVASVDGAGLVTALSPGKCTVTATSADGKTGVCAVEVGNTAGGK